MRGTNLTAVEGNASVYQVYPVSRITGERRSGDFKGVEPGFEQEGEVATQSVRGNYKSFKGTNLTVAKGMHQIIMYIL